MRRPITWVRLAAALAISSPLAACTTAQPSTTASSEDTTMTSSSSFSPEHPTPSTTTPTTEISIRVTFADTTLIARLADNATANDLLSQLPMTLTFRDFNHVEKISDPPRPLSTAGAPPGADPDIGDI